MLDEYKQDLTDNGIVTQLSTPRTPQQNGVVERRNRTLLDMVRCMMCHATLPESFWGYALETAMHILNLVPSKSISKTPHDMWTGQLRRSGRVSRPPERFMYFGESVLAVSDELEPDPTSYEEGVSDVDADHWLKSMESELESMYSNEVWDLMDVKTAFLNGHLDESIYMMQPTGFVAES
ncbi:uncharacterized protein LOC120012507 [Tripterygium wilfordii]|uniref:uncharacterized protein LOC120012507 n=1 Tax=Tripterygium wilfordii TaxID=458696 RepID=UPI0018F840FB|nr:uncharacterized protein LOC120012507 [Tripterygium wilfordii]